MSLLPHTKNKHGNLREFLSPAGLVAAVRLVVRRFPVPTVYVLLSTFWSIGLIWDAFSFKDYIDQAVAWCLSMGFMIALAVNIWCEYLHRPSLTKPLEIAGAALTVLYFASICVRGGLGGDAELVGRIAITTGLVVAVVFLPAGKSLSEKGLRNYTLSMIGTIAASFCLAIVMAIAIGIIWGTLHLLFALEAERVFMTAMVIFAFAMPSIFFLHLTPGKDLVISESNGINDGLIPGFCKNVLLPLVAIYTSILYVYLGTIIVKMSLPKDSVSMMVTGLISAVLVTLYGLRAYRLDKSLSATGTRLESIAASWLPKAMIPLLLLMSFGLIYRIAQYGITPARLYMATFNLWAYCVSAALILRRSTNLNAVAASFAIVFVAVSIVPGANFTTIGYKAVKDSILRHLPEDVRRQLPMQKDQFKEVLNGMPIETATEIASRLEYLDSWDNHSRVCDIVVSEYRLGEWNLLDDHHGNTAVVVVDNDALEFSHNGSIGIPAGYSAVEYFETSRYGLPMRNGDKAYVRRDNIEIGISPDKIREMDSLSTAGASTPLWYKIPEGCVAVVNARMMCTPLANTDSMTIDRISLKGYIFRK